MKETGFRPNIAFAGLTAAGKTTHAKILAEQLGYEYVSATQTTLDILDMKDDPDGVWFAKYDEIEKDREGDRIDVELEARMEELANSQDSLVLDTWAMAWIYSGRNPMIRLWVESDEPSRTRKCFVSQGNDPENDLTACNELIKRKDGDTRQKFMARLNYDLFADKERYDVIIDNTALIPEANRSTSDKGIKIFAPIVQLSVNFMIEHQDKFDDGAIDNAKKIIAASRGIIIRLGGVELYD